MLSDVEEARSRNNLSQANSPKRTWQKHIMIRSTEYWVASITVGVPSCSAALAITGQPVVTVTMKRKTTNLSGTSECKP